MTPRIIFTYWHQGFEAAPAVPRACLDQIRRTHSDCDIHALDSSDLEEIRKDIPLSEDVWNKLAIPHQSDLIRTALLLRHGGIWMDPTVYPLSSSWDWLQDKMDAGLFFFQRPGRDRLISNWLIAAERGHPVLADLLEKLCAYHETRDWREPSAQQARRHSTLSRLINRHPDLTRLWLWKPLRYLVRQPPYLIYHYALYDLLCSKPHLRDIWNKMPVISALPPHKLQRIGLQAPVSADAKAQIADPEVPLFKLTWKLPKPEVVEGSVLDYLFSHG